jgi:hypothetical protein
MEFIILLGPLLAYLILTFFKSYIDFEGAKIIALGTHCTMLILAVKLLIEQYI